MGCVAPVYRPRDAEHTVLHQVVAEHLEAFLGAVAEAADGAGLPQFVEREFREFLTCGVFAIDVLACAHCGGRMHLIATLHDPAVIRKILAHLALSPLGAESRPRPSRVRRRRVLIESARRGGRRRSCAAGRHSW